MMPNRRYNGQKLTKLVRAKTAASTSRMMPVVPVMVSLNYSAAMITATASRSTRSILPMFARMMRMVLCGKVQDHARRGG